MELLTESETDWVVWHWVGAKFSLTSPTGAAPNLGLFGRDNSASLTLTTP